VNPTLRANLAVLRRRVTEGNAPAMLPTDFVLMIVAEMDRLEGLINTPHTADFLEAVKLEAAHQRERWAAEHDDGKTDADWFWLVGYLAGKALHSGKLADDARDSDSLPEPLEVAAKHADKRLHHIITTAAALANWHLNLIGADTRMRPGIASPEARR
jgi:hypothetical protein